MSTLLPEPQAPRDHPVETALVWVIRGGLLLLPFVALLVAGFAPFEIRAWRETTTPKLALPDIWYGWVTWKNFSFRVAVEVLFALWIVLAAIAPRYRPRFSWLLAAVTALAAVMTAADLLGVAPYRSVWSNFERMQGLVGQLHLWAFFLVAGAVLRPRHWGWFFHVSIGVCVLIGIDALFEWTYEDAPGRLKVFPEFGDRIGGKFGSPVHLGDYLLFHLFLVAFFGLRSKDLTARLCYALVGLLFAALLFGTGTRAAWAGVLGGATVAAAAAGALGGDPRLRRITLWTAGVSAAAVAVSVLLASLAPTVFEDIPILNRFGSTGQRLELMLSTCASAWHGFLERPLLGWGHENFTYVFDRFYYPAFYAQPGWMWNDRPHNLFLQWLVEGGFAGFTAWLALLAALGYHLWHRSNTALSVIDKSVLTGLVAGYLIFTSAQPDELLATLLFTAVCGLVHATWIERTAPAPRRGAPLWTLAVLVPLAGAATWFALEQINFRAIRAGTMLTKTNHRPGFIHKVLAEGSFLRAEAIERFVTESVPKLPPKMDAAQRAALVSFGLEGLQREIAIEPGRVRNYWNIAHYLIGLRKYEEALGYMQQAAQLAPKHPRVAFVIPWILYRLGPQRVDEARQAFAAARDLHPDGEYEPSISFPAIHVPTKEEREQRFKERLERGKKKK